MSDTWGLFTASIIADRFTNLLCLTGVLIERRVCCPQCSSPSFSGEWQQPKQLQTELQDNQRRQCYKCEADVEIDYLIQPRGQKTGMVWLTNMCMAISKLYLTCVSKHSAKTSFWKIVSLLVDSHIFIQQFSIIEMLRHTGDI